MRVEATSGYYQTMFISWNRVLAKDLLMEWHHSLWINDNTGAHSTQCLVRLEFAIESDSSETMLNCAIALRALIIH